MKLPCFELCIVPSLLWCSLLLLIPGVANGATLRDLLLADDSLSLFRGCLSALRLLEDELDDTDRTYTIFAPTNKAMQESRFFQLYMSSMDQTVPRWKHHLDPAVRNHMVENEAMTEAQIFDGSKNHIFSMEDSLVVHALNGDTLGLIGGARIEAADLRADNGILHVIDKVMPADFFAHSFEELERQQEFGPDWLDRVSLQTIVDFNNARRVYTSLVEEGQTMVGCRIRALNRIGLFYLPKTLNRSPEIKFGEFLNASNREQTVHDMIEYSLIHKNYYRIDLPDHYIEWVMASNGCSHILVSKSSTGRLCFNDGCQVADPKPREFLANNGYGYVVDKCIVCSGAAMLLEYAAVYSPYSLKDAAQFWESSEWNLRNLSMSVGDGRPVTIFAAIDAAFDVFASDDRARLSTDKWKVHQLNFLRHNMLQGVYMEDDFVELWYNNSGKEYNITALSGENITFDYDEERKKVMVEGGDLWFSNIKGIDGYLHLIAALPVPKSVTHYVYDLGASWEDYTTQITLIDTVFLKQDLRRLAPITGLFAHNDDWANKVIELEDISKAVLENHIFAELWWCSTLRDMVGQDLESHNGQTWTVSVNETTNMPCFDTVAVFGGPIRRSCITECDILARNGVVHKVDKVLFFEVPRTAGPQVAKIPTYRHPSAPTFYKPPAVPLNGWYLPRPTFYGKSNPAYFAAGDEGYEDLSASTRAAAYGWSTLIVAGTMLFYVLV